MRLLGYMGLIGAGAALAGCQSSLHSDLPAGPDAYTVISGTREESANRLNQLQPGDQISVVVYQEPSLSPEKVTVDPAGNVSLPLIGEMHAAGLSSSELAKRIEDTYAARYLRDPHVNINLLESAPRVVAVEGAVTEPGVFPVQEGYTLLTALALARSPTDVAKLDEVLIFRTQNGERLGGRFDVNDIRAGRSPDPVILSGDTVVVGYSAIRGAYLDFLKTAPLIGAFQRY